MKEMKKLYTIGFHKLIHQVIGWDAEHHFRPFEIKNVDMQGEKMTVFFCENEKGIFVVAGKSRKGAAYRCCGHWHSGNLYYDIYFRKNFRTNAEGNAFYKQVKSTMSI